MKNPILESIRQTREHLLAESGGTLDGLVKRLQAEEATSVRVFRPPQPQVTAAPLDSTTNPSDAEMAKMNR